MASTTESVIFSIQLQVNSSLCNVSPIEGVASLYQVRQVHAAQNSTGRKSRNEIQVSLSLKSTNIAPIRRWTHVPNVLEVAKHVSFQRLKHRFTMLLEEWIHHAGAKSAGGRIRGQVYVNAVPMLLQDSVGQTFLAYRTFEKPGPKPPLSLVQQLLQLWYVVHIDRFDLRFHRRLS